MYLVISCSLNSESRSRILAQAAFDLLQRGGHDVKLADLRELQLPACDADQCYEDPNVQGIAAMIRQADGILVASPIYNYDVSAQTKNLIELTGRAWQEKVVGFLCAAGGYSSYMSVMGLANSLMLDFRSYIVPRFVYASGHAFDETSITDPKVQERLEELTRDLVRLATALK